MVPNNSSNTFDIRPAAKFITAIDLSILSVGMFFVAKVVYRNNIADKCRTVVESGEPSSSHSVDEWAQTIRVYPTPTTVYIPRMPKVTRYEICTPKIKLKSTLPFSIGGPIAFVGFTLLIGTKRSKFDLDVSEDI